MPFADFLRYVQSLPTVQKEFALVVAVGVAAAFSEGGIDRLRHSLEGWEYQPMPSEERSRLEALGIEVT